MGCKTCDLDYKTGINSQKKKIEDNYKNNIKKKKYRAIRLYEAKFLTNQMLKDEIKKKKSITQKDLKNKGEKNIN
jgi:hypothetical protein